MPTVAPSPIAEFGIWLRGLREARGLALREVAAGAKMDQALLSNIERGCRLPSIVCGIALAAFFKIDTHDFQSRLLAARLWKDYGADNPALLAAAAARVSENAATYGGRKSAKKKT
jgi:DNA-binding XRE family transcriptional regulator